MKNSKTSTNPNANALRPQRLRHSLQHTSCSPKCFKRGTLKGQQAADAAKPQDSQSKNWSKKKSHSKHRLQRVEKNKLYKLVFSVYSSVCTSTAIGWSVCVNRKRKESKWKHKSLRDQNSLVHKTGRKDKLRNCRQGRSFLLRFSFVYRNKTSNSWERGGKQNTYQEKAHPRC